jgi:hypothetical protein
MQTRLRGEAAGGGVWKTTDGGNLTPLTDTSDVSLGDIDRAFQSFGPYRVPARRTTGRSNFGRGILVSADAGSTWTLTTALPVYSIRIGCPAQALSTRKRRHRYAAMADFPANGIYGTNTGVWKTTNSGGTWTNTTAAVALNSSDPWSAVVIDPNNGQIIYAALGRYDGIAANGVYKSTNGGATWNLLANGPTGIAAGRIAIAVSKSNSQVVYVTASGTGLSGSTAFGSLYKFVRSDDGGATFNNTLTAGTPNYLGGQGWYDTTVAVDPTNSAIVYVGGAAGPNSILRSTTSGQAGRTSIITPRAAHMLIITPPVSTLAAGISTETCGLSFDNPTPSHDSAQRQPEHNSISRYRLAPDGSEYHAGGKSG